MKRLLLLRHAQAMPMDGGKDKDRKLTPKGQEDAGLLGALMVRLKLVPEKILCSDAQRTKETAAAMNKKFPAPVATNFLPELYDASRGELFAALQTADNNDNVLMILGHNPAIYELCAMLANDGPAPLLGRMDQGYAPATLSVFEFPVYSWEEIDSEEGKLVEYLSPSDYNSPSPAKWN